MFNIFFNYYDNGGFSIMKLVDTDKYKGYTIKVYKQKPNIKIPITKKEWDKHFNRSDLDGVLGSHAYEVLNKNNEIECSNNCDMWDIYACIDYASQDIDNLTWGNNDTKG